MPSKAPNAFAALAALALLAVLGVWLLIDGPDQASAPPAGSADGEVAVAAQAGTSASRALKEPPTSAARSSKTLFLEGIVLDYDGTNPARGRGVTLTPLSAPGGKVPIAETVTDEEGHFRFEGLRPGRVRLSAGRRPDLRGETTVEAVAGATDIRIVLEPQAFVSLTDAERTPVEGTPKAPPVLGKPLEPLKKQGD